MDICLRVENYLDCIVKWLRVYGVLFVRKVEFVNDMLVFCVILRKVIQ